MGNLWNSQLSLLIKCSVVILLCLPCCLSYHHAPTSTAGYKPSYDNHPDEESESYAEVVAYGSHKPQEHSNLFHDERVVDKKARYKLEWTVDYKTKMITFNITVKTTGWVGLGLSKDGKMKDADIMIAWVGVNGQGIIMDLHSDHNRKLGTDSQQNWKLLASSEVGGVTNILVTRPLDTCDPMDYPITIDLLWVLWAYGETDVLEYHFDKRGSFRAYFLDPVLKSNEPHLEMFRLANEVTLDPAKTTSYICSIHKGPHFTRKHHMVELHPYTENELSTTHTHHLIIYYCVAPPGMFAKDIFEQFLDFPGEECYFNDNRVLPINLCRLIVGGWAIGGKPYILPDSTGLPVGEEFDQYFLIESHFDNPEGLPLTLSAGMDIFYTNKLRQNDGGAMIVAYDSFGIFMVPPTSTNFEVYGFCTENCTQSIIPADTDFEILAVLLHTHYTGRKVKLQHFREGHELEWIMKDDNFDSTFQQTRVLYEPRKVLPGDLLVIKCEYDNSGVNGTTTFAGFSTREEMCLAGISISKRVPYSLCLSQVPVKTLLSTIGVEEYAWEIASQARVVTAPSSLAGNLVSYVADELTDWTKALRKKQQELQLYTPSEGSCPQVLVPTITQTSTHHHSLGTHTHQKQQNTAHIEEQQQKLLGTVISDSADFGDILTLAKGYGDTTLMGDNTQMPNRMPGPYTSTVYPYGAQRYNSVRTCPRVASTPSYPAHPAYQAPTGPYTSTTGSYAAPTGSYAAPAGSYATPTGGNAFQSSYHTYTPIG